MPDNNERLIVHPNELGPLTIIGPGTCDPDLEAKGQQEPLSDDMRRDLLREYRKVKERALSVESAQSILQRAADLIGERAHERDTEQERTMARTVATFNAMTGHKLTVEEGWQFMVYLKHSRMRGGGFKPDDYHDAVGYEALMAEEAIEANRNGRGEHNSVSQPDKR